MAAMVVEAGEEAEFNPLEELHEVLRHFPLHHAEEHALPEFGATWASVVRALHRKKQAVRAATVAGVLVNVARRERFATERIDSIAATLRIKCVALNAGREWYMLQLLERSAPEEEDAAVALGLLTQRVGRALREAYRSDALTPEVHCVKMSGWCYASVRLVSAAGRTRSPLYLAVPHGRGALLVSRRADKKLLTAVAEGLGYASVADARLSGRHLDSLLRIYEQRQNTNALRLAGAPAYEPRPVDGARGVDYTHAAYDAAHAERLLGPDPPVLGTLEMRTEQPFLDETLGDTMKIYVKMSSDNIADTLRVLVKGNVIPANSVWFNVFNTMNSNQLSGSAFEEAEY